MAAVKTKYVPFGQANIELTDLATGEKIYFRGKNTGTEDAEYLQVEGGSVSIEPDYEEIKFEDLGTAPYDHVLVGYKGTLKIVAGQEDIRMLKIAMSGTVDVGNTTDGITGVTDGPLGASNRARAMSARIHPRNLPDTNKDHDFNIYMLASTGGYERPYGNEQGKIELEMQMYPRDGANASEGGNFFYTGGVDPHEGEAPVVAGPIVEEPINTP